jgi:hypothetical protein
LISLALHQAPHHSVGRIEVATRCLSVQDWIVPTVLRIGAFRFHFYSDERLEPPHIHVRTPDGECKFWLEPGISLAGNRGIPAHDLRKIEKLVFEHHTALSNAFHEYHYR